MRPLTSITDNDDYATGYLYTVHKHTRALAET